MVTGGYMLFFWVKVLEYIYVQVCKIEEAQCLIKQLLLVTKKTKNCGGYDQLPRVHVIGPLKINPLLFQ